MYVHKMPTNELCSPVAERLGVKTLGVPATPEALNSRYPEEREKWPKAKKAPSSPPPPPTAANTQPAAQLALCVLRLCGTTGMSIDSGEVSLWHLHCVRDPTSLHDHRDVHTVDELRHQHNKDIDHLVEEEFVHVELLPLVEHLLHLLHCLLQTLIFFLLINFLEFGLLTLLTFHLVFSSSSSSETVTSISFNFSTHKRWRSQ